MVPGSGAQKQRMSNSPNLKYTLPPEEEPLNFQDHLHELIPVWAREDQQPVSLKRIEASGNMCKRYPKTFKCPYLNWSLIF